jgi:hypothetical protein
MSNPLGERAALPGWADWYWRPAEYENDRILSQEYQLEHSPTPTGRTTNRDDHWWMGFQEVQRFFVSVLLRTVR